MTDEPKNNLYWQTRSLAGESEDHLTYFLLSSAYCLVRHDGCVPRLLLAREMDDVDPLSVTPWHRAKAMNRKRDFGLVRSSLVWLRGLYDVCRPPGGGPGGRGVELRSRRAGRSAFRLTRSEPVRDDTAEALGFLVEAVQPPSAMPSTDFTL